MCKQQNANGTNRNKFSQEFLVFMEYITDTLDQKADAAFKMICFHVLPADLYIGIKNISNTWYKALEMFLWER